MCRLIEQVTLAIVTELRRNQQRQMLHSEQRLRPDSTHTNTRFSMELNVERKGG
jgi:hypothetical protein